MTRLSTILLILILLSGLSSAWGANVSKFICENSVMSVWGASAVNDCLAGDNASLLGTFCEANAFIMGNESYGRCRKDALRSFGVHPALISDEVFHDETLHYDYSHCPITKGSVAQWICGNSGERPAIIEAEKWFTAAEAAPDLCTRIYDFCVGGSYFADSESELHQVRPEYYYGSCQKEIEDAADKLILNNLTSWSAGETCSFRLSRETTPYRQRLAVASTNVDAALSYLYNRGLGIRDEPLHPKNAVIILANSVDEALASGLYDFLKNSSVDVHFSTADEFEQLRYNPRIIILGGQNSPGGVGDIVSTILVREEKESLLAPNAEVFLTKTDVWKSYQKVLIVAGNEKEDTEDAWTRNRDRILSEVSS